MLSRCREKLPRESKGVQSKATLVEADMRTFDLMRDARRPFALATIPFRPFQHLLTVEDQLASLATIHHHLADGGRLILDVLRDNLEPEVAARAPDRTARRERHPGSRADVCDAGWPSGAAHSQNRVA